MRPAVFFVSIVLIFSIACKKLGIESFNNQQKTGQTASSPDSIKASDRPSESTGSLPGYLTLGCTLAFAADGFAVESACLIADQNGKVSLEGLAKSWTWQYVLSVSPTPTITVTELPQDNPNHVIYRFSGLERETLLTIAKQTKFTISMQLKDGLEPILMSETKEKIVNISSVARYRFVRITFLSLKLPWTQSQEMDIEGMELKWENQWRRGVFTDYTGTLGPYEVAISGSSFAVNNSSFPYNAFKRSAAGKIWETAERTYEITGAYNAVGPPQWLKIDFKDHPVAIQGIKIDGGDSAVSAGSEGAPDVFYLEGSADDITWTLIEGSRQDNVDTTVMTPFEWDK